MTAIVRLLFPVPAYRRSPVTLLRWWERRRPAYNLIVGGAGVVSLATLRVLELLPPHPRFPVSGPVVLVYGVMANVCYTFGFSIEALLERLWGGDVAPVGPTLFRYGLMFSVGLTLLPIGLGWLGYLASVAQLLLP